MYFCPDPRKCCWEGVLLILTNAQTVLYLILVGLSGRPSHKSIGKEQNDYMCLWAYVLALIVYQIGGLVTGELTFGIGTVVAAALVVMIICLLFRKGYTWTGRTPTLTRRARFTAIAHLPQSLPLLLLAAPVLFLAGIGGFSPTPA